MKKMRWILVCAVLVAVCCAPAIAEISLDRATQDYLEGSWRGAGPSGSDACASAAPHYQMDIEFRRTGGRVLDLTRGFPPVARAIIAAERNGDEISLTLAPLIGLPEMREVLRIVSPKRMELHPSNYDHTPYENYWSPLDRCFAPRKEVNESVPLEDLQVLSSTGKDLILFKEEVSGQTEAQICSATPSGYHLQPGETLRVDSLQFEVFGPVHYLVRGHLDAAAWRDRLRDAMIESIHPSGDGTLKFELSGPATGKDTDGGTQHFSLTTQWDGRHLFVPEIGKRFVRCRVTSMFGAAEPAPVP